MSMILCNQSSEKVLLRVLAIDNSRYILLIRIMLLVLRIFQRHGFKAVTRVEREEWAARKEINLAGQSDMGIAVPYQETFPISERSGFWLMCFPTSKNRIIILTREKDQDLDHG